MTDPQTPATAAAVLEVLTNEGWVADPDATEYNLRVVAHVLRAALAEPPALGVKRQDVYDGLPKDADDEMYALADGIYEHLRALLDPEPFAFRGGSGIEVLP